MQPFLLHQQHHHLETVVRAGDELLLLSPLALDDDTSPGMRRGRLALERKSRVAHGAVSRRKSLAHLVLVQQSIQAMLHSAKKPRKVFE